MDLNKCIDWVFPSIVGSLRKWITSRLKPSVLHPWVLGLNCLLFFLIHVLSLCCSSFFYEWEFGRPIFHYSSGAKVFGNGDTSWRDFGYKAAFRTHFFVIRGKLHHIIGIHAFLGLFFQSSGLWTEPCLTRNLFLDCTSHDPLPHKPTKTLSTLLSLPTHNITLLFQPKHPPIQPFTFQPKNQPFQPFSLPPQTSSFNIPK